MHLLIVICTVGVTFQLSGKNILNFPSDDEIIVRFRKQSRKDMDLNATRQAFIHI